MKTALLRSGSSRGILFLTSLLVAAAASMHGDEIDMQNGDHYTGKVVALDNTNVVLNSEVLGTLRLSREKVSTISFGTKPSNPTPAPASTPQLPKTPHVTQLAASATARPNPDVNLNSSLSHEIATHPELVNEVRTEVLAGAGPKAATKFDALVDGLASGNLNVAGLRKEAESVAAQLRQLRGSEDDESAEIFDEYLAVLDQFLKQTGTTAARSNLGTPAKPAPTTRKPSPPAASKPFSPVQPADE